MAETPSRAAGQKLLREKIADIERQVGEWIGRQEDYAHYRDNLAGFRDAFLANWRRDITDYGRYPPPRPPRISPRSGLKRWTYAAFLPRCAQRRTCWTWISPRSRG